MINELPTAFPWMHKDLTCTGMTLRDYFAAKAMQAMIAEPSLKATPEEFAQRSYMVAEVLSLGEFLGLY